MNDMGFRINEISADKLQYHVVRKAWIISTLAAFSIVGVFISILIAIYMVHEQVLYFHKNYRRTMKGKELLNKAYALKNYLKEYSLIKDRTEKELPLWRDYLIYAAALDVNVKLEDEVLEKYIQNVARSTV